MSKGKKKTRKRHLTNPDRRHRSQVPAPEIEEVESKLYQLLFPSLMAPRLMERANPKDPERPIRMRARVLRLPVMMAIIIGLVFRRLPSLAEVQRVLEREGVLWIKPLKVSNQAINKRLDTMPASVVGQLFDEVCERIAAQPSERWKHLEKHFSGMWMVDGSALEELCKKTGALREVEGPVLAGKIMVMVDGFGLKPVWHSYIEDAKANDKRFCEQILEALVEGGLLVYDLGFYSFEWFDKFSDQGSYFVTRMREKTAYDVVEVLSKGPHHKDQIIKVGKYRSSPCKHQLRLVEVLWGNTWYKYLTNVLDPEMLSAKDVCELYRRRWRIEDAFKITKRVLDLAYLWSGSSNAVQLQVYATLIFYMVLMDVCSQVAEALNEPLETISVEMVFRGFYHYSSAIQRGETLSLVAFFVEHAKLLGLIKKMRKRDKEQQIRTLQIWADP